MCIDYVVFANTVPFYRRCLSIRRIWYPWGICSRNLWIPKDECIQKLRGYCTQSPSWRIYDRWGSPLPRVTGELWQDVMTIDHWTNHFHSALAWRKVQVLLCLPSILAWLPEMRPKWADLRSTRQRCFLCECCLCVSTKSLKTNWKYLAHFNSEICSLWNPSPVVAA